MAQCNSRINRRCSCFTISHGFSIASGVKPEQGLYTAIIAAFCVGIFGGSRIQIAEPTGAFIVILANIKAHYGVSGLQIASLLAGFILLFMGFLILFTCLSIRRVTILLY